VHRRQPAGFPGPEGRFNQLRFARWDSGEAVLLLAFWRLSDEEINYRRFFAINDLIGVRVADPVVFRLTHAMVLRLVEEGKVTGLRIDPIDGLLDPLAYLQQLREQISPEPGREAENRGQVYTVVEKILSVDERLCDEWPVEGTTGYDFLNLVNAVFVDPSGAHGLQEIYHRFVDSSSPFEDILYEQKMLVIRTLFAGEIRSLGLELDRLGVDGRPGGGDYLSSHLPDPHPKPAGLGDG